MIEFSNNLKKGGLFMIGSVLEGTSAELGNLVRPLTIQWLDFIALAKIKGFPEINIAPVVRDGMESLLLVGFYIPQCCCECVCESDCEWVGLDGRYWSNETQHRGCGIPSSIRCGGRHASEYHEHGQSICSS